VTPLYLDVQPDDEFNANPRCRVRYSKSCISWLNHFPEVYPMSHKFSVGQTVVFTPSAGEVLGTATKGTITRLLPKDGADYQYHVQVDPHGPERRALESQLQPPSATAIPR
jgi:hypothetical protein